MSGVAARRRWPAVGAVALAVALAAGSHAGAQDARWSPVRDVLAGRPVDAASDGPRTLVAIAGRSTIRVAPLARGRIGSGQVVARGRGLRRVQLRSLPGGAALVVWEEPGRVRAAYRPSRAARFGSARTLSRHPDAATGAALASTVAVAPGGRVVVAWWGGPAGGRLGIYATRMVAGRWSAPVEISAGVHPQTFGPPIVATASAAGPDGGVA